MPQHSADIAPFSKTFFPMLCARRRERFALISTKLSNWVRFRRERRKGDSRGRETAGQSQKRDAQLIWSSRGLRERGDRRLRDSLSWTKTASQAAYSLPI